jgi:hypothetical protein
MVGHRLTVWCGAFTRHLRSTASANDIRARLQMPGCAQELTNRGTACKREQKRDQCARAGSPARQDSAHCRQPVAHAARELPGMDPRPVKAVSFAAARLGSDLLLQRP